MLFVFDLDFTLFDAESLKMDLAEAFGISYDELIATYYEYFRLPKKQYNPFEHLDYLMAGDPTLDKAAALARLDQLGAKMNDKLYPDALKVLDVLKSRDQELVLLTQGHQAWQSFKIDHLAIKPYFADIMITSNKIDSLKPYSERHGEMIIVNDNGQECLDIINIYQPRDVVLVEGPYTYNATHTMPVRKLVDCLKVDGLV